MPRWFRQDNGTVVLDQRRARARGKHHHQMSVETRGLFATKHHVCRVAIATSFRYCCPILSVAFRRHRACKRLVRSIVDCLPPRLQGSIEKAIRLIRDKPENTFIRVAYTTPGRWWKPSRAATTPCHRGGHAFVARREAPAPHRYHITEGSMPRPETPPVINATSAER